MERLGSEIGRLKIADLIESGDCFPVLNSSGIQAVTTQQMGIAGDKIIYVYEASDFPDAIGGVITLENKAYWLMNSGIVLSDTLDFSAGASIFNPTWRVSNLITTASPAIQSAELLSSSIIGVVLIGDGTNKLFDLASTSTGFLSLHISVFVNFDDLGATIGCSVVGDNVAFLTFNTGLVSTNGDTYTINTVRMRSNSDTNALTLAGTWTGLTVISGSDITTGSGGHAVKIDSATVAEQVSINNIIYPSGAFFDPAGLNQEDTFVAVSNVQNIFDSTIAGSMQFTGNGDATVISAVGISGDITAFADAGGGQVTVSDATHGQSNDDFVLIAGTTNYNGLYTIANATANDYEITATFVATETGTAEYGWTDIVGTATAGETIERFTVSNGAANELTYTGTTRTKSVASIDITGTNGASGRIIQSLLFRKPKNGIYNAVPDSIKTGGFDLRAKSLDSTRALLIEPEDTLKVMIRNTEAEEDITVIENTINIQKA